MLFNSIAFIIFISIVFLFYSFIRLRGQNLFLLAASYFFYGYWDWRFIFLLFTSTLINYSIGQKIHRSHNQDHKKLLLIVCIIVNLSILCFFKYFNFFIESAASLLTLAGLEPHTPVLKIILPVGISFYTFQTMSYTIDIYRKRLGPTTNFVDFALFVSFFPQLVAGPIERATNLLPQISKPRQLTQTNIIAGLNLVLLGYFKKVAIADTLAPIVQNIFDAPATMSSGQLLTGIYAFTFQIYGDFSGYTDIARGIALIFGFKLMENFNAPYLSRSISEFWRRWHISLSTWLRDYLYIPLGGNRNGERRTYLNLMITMFLGGLWHGAAWNFVIWGVLHGIYLSIHRVMKKSIISLHLLPDYFSGWVSDFCKIIFTFHVVAFTWVFFRSPDFASSLVYLRGIFIFQQLTSISPSVIFAGLMMLLIDVAQSYYHSHTWLTDSRSIISIRYFVIQLLLVSVLAAAIAHIKTVSPFIYFQF